MKEAWKRQRDSSNTSTGFTVQAGALWRVTPARELEPTGTHRLGLDIGGYWKSTRNVRKEYHCWATKKDKLWLGYCLLSCPWHPTGKIKVNNCPFISLWVGWGVSSKPPARGKGV
jgi:hypothetical protein